MAHDEEKAMKHPAQVQVDDISPETETGAVYVSRYGRAGRTILGPLFKAGVEARGIERVPEEERSDRNTWNNLLMWFVSISDNSFCSYRTDHGTLHLYRVLTVY
jgi:hypothetical protein